MNKNDKLPENVPFAVYEKAMIRTDAQLKRLWIALIIAILLIFASNGVWIVYESLYDTISYSQDGQGVNNICTGSQGDVYGAKSPDKKEMLRQEQGR